MKSNGRSKEVGKEGGILCHVTTSKDSTWELSNDIETSTVRDRSLAALPSIWDEAGMTHLDTTAPQQHQGKSRSRQQRCRSSRGILVLTFVPPFKAP